MKSIQEILTSGTAYLEARGIESARHSMQSLMVDVLGCNRTWLYLHYEDPMSEEKLIPLRELLKRRGKGEPLQHLLGSTEFYRRDFRTDSRWDYGIEKFNFSKLQIFEFRLSAFVAECNRETSFFRL